MSFIKNLKGMDKTFSWSFLSFLLGIIFGIIGLYTTFIREVKPDLSFFITSDYSVLDINEKVGTLEIFNNGESLSKHKKELRIIVLNVVNMGNEVVLQSYYDLNDPIGISLSKGLIVDNPTLINSSNDYLSKNIKIKKSDNSIYFSNAILEEKDFYSIKILVLSDEGTLPEIIPHGKIAKDNIIDIIRLDKESTTYNKIEKIFEAGLLPNLIVFIIYGILFLLITLIVIIIAFKLLRIKKKSTMKKNIKKYIATNQFKLNKIDELLLTEFIDTEYNLIPILTHLSKEHSISNDLFSKNKYLRDLLNKFIKLEILTLDKENFVTYNGKLDLDGIYNAFDEIRA